MFFKTVASIFIFCGLVVIAPTVFAAHSVGEVPVQHPLLPPPDGTEANYSGNVNSGPNNDPNAAAVANQAQIDQANNGASSPTGLSETSSNVTAAQQSLGSNPKASPWLVVLVTLLSATGLIFIVYKVHKERF